jgi:hypothetical protein
MSHRCFTPDALLENFKKRKERLHYKAFESIPKKISSAHVTKNLAIVNCFDQPIKRLWRCISGLYFSLGEEDAKWILQVFIYMFSSDGRPGFRGFPPSQ